MERLGKDSGKPSSTESVDYLTLEQKQNLLEKNSYFAAEHEAFVSTLKKS